MSTPFDSSNPAPALKNSNLSVRDAVAPVDQHLPRVRDDLVVRRTSDQEFVVKLRSRREYFSVGPQEAFLLEALREEHTAASLAQSFEDRYHEQLTEQEIEEFLQLLRSKRLLAGQPEDAPDAESEAEDEDDLPTGRQSLLFYRVPLYDPDAAFSRWAPRLRWIWTRGFLFASLSLMAAALLIVCQNLPELAAAAPGALRWETFLLGWLVVIVATALHEMAHGLTCKHFGGDVHETGVLLMFFMPCLYCNVSDAWLIPEKSRRMLITAAGGYSDLCLWAIAVIVWRLTVPDSVINFVAFVILTVCGTRGLINFNPFFKLDGYYLLSDWLSLPNLRRRAREHWTSHLRWLLWGAERPQSVPAGRTLVIYGALTWCAALLALDLVLLRMLKYASDQFGMLGIASGILLLLYAIRRVFRGLFRSELMTMLRTRHGRTAKWGLAIASVAALAFVIPVKHYATGDFEVRPGTMHQVQAPVNAFIRQVFVEEGEQVTAGAPLMQLESPDLANQIEIKTAELAESDAVLAKLRAGPRREEVQEQRERVARLQAWRDLGARELLAAQRRLEQELIVLEQQVEQGRAEVELAQASLSQSEQLYRLGAFAGAELRVERTQLALLRSRVRQAEAERGAREAEGVRAAEAELAKREQQLADAEAALTLLEAGTRPEEIAAEEARRKRLSQEVCHLEAMREKLLLRAPVDGAVAMPRMREKVGTHVPQGTPICAVEDADRSFIEIHVSEDHVTGVKPGLPVRLKARALPFETFDAIVERIAPSTTAPVAAMQRPTLVVYCQLENPDGQLRTGMSGFGRIERGWRTVGLVLSSKAMRYLRTEFWW